MASFSSRHFINRYGHPWKNLLSCRWPKLNCSIQLMICLLFVSMCRWTMATQADWTSFEDTSQQIIRLASKVAGQQYERLLEEFWTWRLEQVPEFATSLGVRQYDGMLESFTKEAFRKRKEQCESFIRSIDAIDSTLLSRDGATGLRVMREEIETFVHGYRWIHYSAFSPINILEGVHKDFTYWIDSMRFESTESFTNYINRLRSLVTQIHEQINLMRETLKFGLTYHRVSIEPVIDVIRSIGTEAPRSPFFKPFNDSLEFVKMSSNRAEKFRTDGASVIQDHVLPAYSKLALFLSQDYLPRTRPQEGLGSLPGGPEYYQTVLKWYLSVDVSAQTLHAVGRESVNTIHAHMDQIRERVGYIGRLEDFVKYANGANKFFYRSEEELLDAYREIVYNRIPVNLTKLFSHTTVTSLQVQAMQFDGPPAVLMPSSDDGSNYPAVFFVNVNNPLKRPKWQLPVIALHETMPGRHLQACYAQNQSFPEFRKWREYRKAYAIPFQFPFHTAYTEGWALYAESLGHELHLLTTAYEQFGRLHSELYRTCEMVVDTGIHSVGWTREDAVKYLVRVTGVARMKAETDVDRIITSPGQAVAPIYGYIQIRRLRQFAERFLGAEYDVRSFHDQVLRLGPVPMNILDDEIRNWVALRSNSSSSHHPSIILFTCLLLILTISRTVSTPLNAAIIDVIFSCSIT